MRLYLLSGSWAACEAIIDDSDGTLCLLGALMSNALHILSDRTVPAATYTSCRQGSRWW